MGAVMLDPIRRASQIEHLIALNGAGSGIHRIRPDTGQIEKIQRHDCAVCLHCHFRRHHMFAGMNVGDKTFIAVGDEFDRTLQQFGSNGSRDIIAISVNLDAE